MYRIKTQALAALYAAMAAKNDLFLPVKAAGKTNFALWQPDADVDIRTQALSRLRHLHLRMPHLPVL